MSLINLLAKPGLSSAKYPTNTSVGGTRYLPKVTITQEGLKLLSMAGKESKKIAYELDWDQAISKPQAFFTKQNIEKLISGIDDVKEDSQTGLPIIIYSQGNLKTEHYEIHFNHQKQVTVKKMNGEIKIAESVPYDLEKRDQDSYIKLFESGSVPLRNDKELPKMLMAA